MHRSVALLLALFLAACSGQEAIETTTSAAGTASTTEAETTTTVQQATTADTTTTADPTTTLATTTTTLPPLTGVTMTPVVDAPFPMVVADWTPGLALVALRTGAVYTFDGVVLSEEPLLSFDVPTSSERGLLGLATSPDRPGMVFAHHSGPSGETVVTRVDTRSGERTVLLTVPQPAGNHNGGSLLFAPDGSLLLALGDGGGANDRFGHGQDTSTLLGGMVQIDPDSGDAALWSWGLRNPFRVWIDGGDIYIGDVGQNAYEEIDVVSFEGAPYNFGWPITEALHCFSPRSGCDVDGLTLPAVEIGRGDGTCSVIGGAVYRGVAIPEFDGRYFYSDYCGGWLRSFVWDGTTATDQQDHTDEVGFVGNVVGMGHGPDGELLVLTTDRILRLDPLR